MRSLSVTALMLLTTACAHGRPDAVAGVVVVAEPCFDSSRHDAINLSVINDSSERVALSSLGTSGPPYILHPNAFAVAAADGTPASGEHWDVLLEEFVPPDHEVSLGPGDRAQFHAYTSQWPTSEYHGQIKLQVRDTRGQSYESQPVPVCVPGAVPDNS